MICGLSNHCLEVLNSKISIHGTGAASPGRWVCSVHADKALFKATRNLSNVDFLYAVHKSDYVDSVSSLEMN